MNEVNVLRDHQDVLSRAQDSTRAIFEILNDLEILLEPHECEGMIAVKELISSAKEDISEVIYDYVKQFARESQDQRDEYLSNLRGYFNENTGTWYEQAEAAYKKLTGLTGNEWTVLPWTATLFAGGSTLRYLINAGLVIKLENNQFQLSESLHKQYLCDASEDDSYFQIDRKRIAYLYETNFQDLKIPLHITLNDFAKQVSSVNQKEAPESTNDNASQDSMKIC